MHRIAFKFVFIYLFVLISGHDVNYCGSKMCGYSNRHTFCQYSPGPSNSCTGLIPAPLLPEEKSRILARLNRRRNSAASGKLRGLPSAANMLRLRWVQELAREAQMWADQCRPPQVPEEHDECRDLYAITVGQCVASVVGEAPGLRVESMVDIWFMQSLYYKGNVTTYEPPDPNKYFYGDFAQILWAGTFMVGCGRSRFMLTIRGRLRTIERLVCNFAPKGPAPNTSLWTIGTPASACPEHSLPYALLTSLCEYQNKLNQLNDNTSMTLEEHVLLNVMLEMGRNESQFEGSLDEIFLSNLAIATEQNFGATTTHYNSVQKREVVDKIARENLKRESTNSINITKLVDSSDTTELQTIQKNTTRLLKKLKIVGRPKAYNMEDLSDTDGDLKEENHDVTKATLSKHKKDFLYDYNFDEDVLEDNGTMRTEPTLFQKQENYFNENDSFEDHTFIMVPITNITVVTLDQTIFDAQINDDLVAEKTLINSVTTSAANNDYSTNKDKVMDDYLSDPETVKQLQDALARVEREATTVSIIPGKNRRDLADSDAVSEKFAEEFSSPSVSDDFTLITDSEEIMETTDISTQEEVQKMSEAPVKILDMMLKYMPYLKSYDNGMTGPSNSSTSLSSAYFGLEPNVSMCLMMLISLYIRNFNVF